MIYLIDSIIHIMEAKSQSEKIKKVEISPKWDDSERLTVIKLIFQNLPEDPSTHDKNVCLEKVKYLAIATSKFLQDNRANFSDFITKPSSN